MLAFTLLALHWRCALAGLVSVITAAGRCLRSVSRAMRSDIPSCRPSFSRGFSDSFSRHIPLRFPEYRNQVRECAWALLPRRLAPSPTPQRRGALHLPLTSSTFIFLHTLCEHGPHNCHHAWGHAQAASDGEARTGDYRGQGRARVIHEGAQHLSSRGRGD